MRSRSGVVGAPAARSQGRCSRTPRRVRPAHPKGMFLRRGLPERFALELIERCEDLVLQRSETANRLACLGAALRFETRDALVEGLCHADQPRRTVVERHRPQAAVVARRVRPDSSTYERPSTWKRSSASDESAAHSLTALSSTARSFV